MALLTTSRRLLRSPLTPSRTSSLVCGPRTILTLQHPQQPQPQPRRRRSHPILHQPPSTRRPLSSFLSSFLTTASTQQGQKQQPYALPQTLHARRLLPYPAAQLYSIIADIDSYRFFLPHCTASQVTAWTRPSSPETPRWPALADLTVGWGPFTQSYTSRVYCVPGSVVEAVSGAAQTTIPASTLRAIGYKVADQDDRETARAGEMGTSGIFESLVTRWTVQPTASLGDAQVAEGGEWTEVSLSIQYRFANPALGFAVGQMADDKVDEMVQAFEDRARRLYGKEAQALSRGTG